jgi:hypothetical protein
MDSWPTPERNPSTGSIAWTEIDRSQLLHVIGVGMVASDQGITIELIAIEIRALGGIVHWRAEFGNTVHPDAGAPEVEVADNLETEYWSLPPSWTADNARSVGATYFRPAPPAGAASSYVVVPRFGLSIFKSQEPSSGVKGNWTFEILAS